MALFKLKATNDDFADAELIPASKRPLNLEEHLENLLERSPWAIADEPLVVIGRQTSAAVENSTIFPDLLAIDKDGNLVIVELKKGRAPREVTAQVLEYAAWANDLSEDDIVEIATSYLALDTRNPKETLAQVFLETFDAEEFPPLKRCLRLFVAAEEIPPAVSRVCRFLRISHGIDISCMEYSVFQTESGETLVSSHRAVGEENAATPRSMSDERWVEDVPVREVVRQAVQEFTHGALQRVFTPKEIIDVILKTYPTFNKSTARCQIVSDCVNHPSRRHYPGGEDRYWRLEKGKFRLFDSSSETAPSEVSDGAT
jgi:hypothetical protein